MLPNSESQPRKQHSSSQDTPIDMNSIHHNCSYQIGILDEARHVVLEDLGSTIPQIPFKDFLTHLAPPQPSFDLEATMKALHAHPKGILTSSSWWKAFNTKPKDQKATEDAIFKPLSDIFNKVVDTIIDNSNLTTHDWLIQFLQNPAMAPTSAERHNMTRPDGYLVLKDKDKGAMVSWSDILLSCEYKQKDSLEDLDDVSLMKTF